MDWAFKHIGFESDGFRIGGLDVWEEEWRSVGNGSRVDLPHPAHPNQIHSYEIHEIGNEASPFRFAAQELSAGVWGFYVPGQRS
jgi:hypothetical protein